MPKLRDSPLAALVSLQRQQLAAAGFERRTCPGPRGPVTWFTAAPSEAATPSTATLVLVHGMGHQAGAWVMVAPALAREHRVVAVDLPGHGDSPPADGPLSLVDGTDGLEAVLDVVAGPVVLVGSSMGGWVSLLYTLRRPERVARLIHVNGSGISWQEGELTANLLPETLSEARELVAAVGNPVPGEEILRDLIATSAAGPGPRLLATLAPELSLDDRLQEIRRPVDLVWGADDGLLPLSYARRLASGLPDARLHVLDDCGHIPYQQCPERFLAVVREVLS